MSQVAETSQRRVLVVDDSKFVRATFRHIIASSFAMREEADGEAGWQALQSDPSIVMVFTDLDMPKLDGYGLLERIRKSGEARIRNLPVIVFSGSQRDASLARARQAGANDFISKSADAAEVLSRIVNMLRTVDGAPPAPAKSLIAEGRKQYASARERGTPLSVAALSIDSYAELAQKAGKDVADQALSRIGAALGTTFPRDSIIGRAAAARFVVISPRADAPWMLVLARQMRERIENAQLKYEAQVHKIRASCGVASLGTDTAGSIEELIQLALQRALAGDSPTAATPPPALDLTPGERAVLRQISRLIADGAATVHAMKELTGSWPIFNMDAYRGGYLGLVKRGLVAPSANGDAFSITNFGLQALRAITSR